VRGHVGRIGYVKVWSLSLSVAILRVQKNRSHVSRGVVVGRRATCSEANASVMKVAVSFEFQVAAHLYATHQILHAILDRWQGFRGMVLCWADSGLAGHGHSQCLMRSFQVVAVAELGERRRIRFDIRVASPRHHRRFERAMKAFPPWPWVLRVIGPAMNRIDSQADHPYTQGRQSADAIPAGGPRGGPLSERICRGRPYRRNAALK